MLKYLVISSIGSDRAGIIRALSECATQCKCNILDTRMAVLGGEFAMIMMLEGPETAITDAEKSIPYTANELGLTTIIKRTQLRDAPSDSTPYRVNVTALDHPGIVQEIAGFFSEQQINIEEMETGTYAAPHTGSPMFSLEMIVNIQTGITADDLQTTFVSFCDERNLDATIEPLC